MEATSSLTASLDHLIELSQNDPTVDRLNQFADELFEVKTAVITQLSAGVVDNKKALNKKLKAVVKAGNLLISHDFSKDEGAAYEAKSDTKAYITYLKCFSIIACCELPEPLAPLQRICAQSSNEILTHLNKIPSNTEAPCTIAKKHSLWNRYLNTMPYDFNCVKLDSDRYISATDTHLEDKRYLIASAPFIRFTDGTYLDTRENWWRMILEHDTRLIVMTTNLYENGKNKCLDYFQNPGTVNSALGNLRDNWICESVKAKKVKSRNGQGIFKRTIQMKGPDDEKRTIVHLQYHNWPDFGASDPKLFLKFHEMMTVEEAKFSTKEHPPLFHCSAGLGRTGTTLALVLMLDRLMKSPDPLNECLDFDSYISSLRLQRAGMVTTSVQYKMIARVLLEYLINESKSKEV